MPRGSPNLEDPSRRFVPPPSSPSGAEGRLVRALLCAVLLGLPGALLLSRAASAETGDLTLAGTLLARMEEAVRPLREYSCSFRKTEWKGRPLPTQEMFLKVRENPRAVYILWTGEAKRGQEVLWSPGRDGGKLLVHPGGGLSFVRLSLDPQSSRAMAESRHPVSETGFRFLLSLLKRDYERALRTGGAGVRVIDRGYADVEGQRSRVLEIEFPKDRDPSYYARRAVLSQNAATGLPSRLQVWDREDGEIRLVEDYTYWNVRENPGFAEADFRPDNPEYRF